MNDTEEWRAIEGFPGYEVSNLGRVRSWRKWGHAELAKTPRLLKVSADHSGYMAVAVSDPPGSGRSVRKSVHRFVAVAFLGPQPDGMQVAHNDGDQSNNRADNLRWATPRENSADMIRHGTVYCGEKHHSSKLTKEQVNTIRNTEARYGALIALAREYGVSEHTIHTIRRRKIWKHL